MPIPAARPSNPALRNEMVITETSELDCRIDDDTTPKPRLFHKEPVVLRRIFSRVPPEHALNPCSSDNMPNKKITTPAEICLKSGLIQNP